MLERNENGEHYITERTMKIIIFLILFTVQAQYIDDELISNESSSVTNDLNLVTQLRNENDRTISQGISDRFVIDETNFSTILPDMISSNATYEGLTWPASISSFSPTSDLDFMTASEDTKTLIEEQWFNVNQSHRRDPFRSILFWKRTNDSSRNGATYILTSEPRCIRQMCSIVLKYNGTLSTRISGCLSFTLRLRGQPIGQLWIVEERDNTSQKIQLTNKTLRIEHSLRSKIKNLSIETRILFRNPQTDRLYLSNLNVNWRGSCPKHRSVPTPSSRIFGRRSTSEDDFMTLSSDGSGLMNTLTTNEEYESRQQDSIYESTTVVFNRETNTKRPFSFTNQKNIGWFLSLISLFCVFVVLSAVGHGLWLLRRQHHFTWHFTLDSQIQFLARRSIRSSTRSEKKIATISELTYDYLQSDLQKEHTDTPTTNSSRSTPISYYTYL